MSDRFDDLNPSPLEGLVATTLTSPTAVGLVAQGRLLETNLNSGGFLSPPLRRGCRAESNNGTLPPEFGATGEVKHPLQDKSDLPALRRF